MLIFMLDLMTYLHITLFFRPRGTAVTAILICICGGGTLFLSFIELGKYSLKKHIDDPEVFLTCFYLTRNLGGGGGGDFVLSLPRCVCPKVKDMGPFLASRE